MPQWNLKELRDHIGSTRSDSAELLGIVRSIDRYTRIFLFHLVGARDAMDHIINPGDPHQEETLKFVFGVSERQDEYHLATVASEAHILGAAHSARAMFDVFAFLVNGLLLDGSIPERDCSIQRVTKELAPSPLKSELDDLTRSYWFDYVSAFVNTAKHRMLVSHSFHVGFQDRYTGVRIGSFQYNGNNYPRYEVREWLEGVLEVKNKIVDCGSVLNKQTIARDV